MNENGLQLLGAVLDNPALRRRFGLPAIPDWCDHCLHGDHDVCVRWGWNKVGCRCGHETEESR